MKKKNKEVANRYPGQKYPSNNLATHDKTKVSTQRVTAEISIISANVQSL
jgi:hypothetical protein